MDKNIIEQLFYLTMGEIAELTKQKKETLKELKYFSNKVKSVKLTAQDLIDSVDTKIRSPRFQ